MRVSGAAAPDVAWERYAAPAAWPSWSPQIRSVEATGARIVPGMTGVVHGPVGILVSFEVLTVDEAQRRWSWRVHAGPVTLDLDHAVLDGAAGGCETRLDATGPALIVVAYLPVATLALRNLVRP